MASKEDLTQALADLDEDRALAIVQELSDKMSAMEIIIVAREGMQQVGDKFAAKEYFLADLIFSAEIFQEIMKKLEPALTLTDKSQFKGKIVIGTVKNDIHDIGKNIIISLLRAAGFEVIDLGVDVPVERFVETVKSESPQVLGLSGLLTIAIEEMKNTIDAIEANGLRETLKIIIGGGPMDEKVRDYVGADASSQDAVEGVNFIKEFID
ncbi:MAG: cobalamin B12-binding domain-containing protein [Candidatus Helarchaeota archaeon]|nr:cobalamin B12-binding domain-containing protein [Candidatus Helarchaeota archaeon]